MEILDFLAGADAVTEICKERPMMAIMSITKLVLQVIRILVPIALIVLGSIDIGKAVVAGDEKKIKEAQKPFVKRIIAAVIVFLIPWLVDIIMGLVGSKDYQTCWGKANGSIKQIQNCLDADKTCE